MTIVDKSLHNFYDSLNELPDQEFEDIVYGCDLDLDDIDFILDCMSEYLEGEKQ